MRVVTRHRANMKNHVRQGYRTLPEGNLSAAGFVSSRVIMIWDEAAKPGTTRPPSIVVIGARFTVGVRLRKEQGRGRP
jgi:hypothetical protein